MRNAIEYYYNVEIEDLKYEDGRYIFNKYLLTPKKRELDLKLYDYINGLNLINYRIVMNINKEYVTNISGNHYILLEKINDYKLNIFNLINNRLLIGNQVIEWDNIWGDKLDYYEKYLKTLSSSKLKQTFIYYSGLTENAIKFYKEIKGEFQIYLSHLRLNQEDYLNPTNLIIDYKSRDIAEYIKFCFFNDYDCKSILNIIFNSLSQNELILFYSRLLYPSYYYDCYEKINNGVDDDILDIYINKIEKYEFFLQYIYFEIKKRVNIPKIDWIIKKDLSNNKSIIHPYQMIED